MTVAIDKPQTSKMQNGAVSLSFTVILKGSNGRPQAVLTNFRLMNGTIRGPASYSRKYKQYYQTVWLYNDEAEAVYAALAASGWVEQFGLAPLRTRAEVIAGIVLGAEVAEQKAPSLMRPVESAV